MSKLKSVEHLLGYFDQQLLAAYRNEPHRFRIESDNFEGELRVTDEYYRELMAAGRSNEALSVRFGYRTLRDGNTCIVAWLPDLRQRFEADLQKWSAFRLRNPEWTKGYDERFDKWVQRYIEGNWEIDNGPLRRLVQIMSIVNGLTTECVGIPLYRYDLDETLAYPAAENTHRYQDSHERLYGYLIDGLDKKCISGIATKLGKDIKISEKKTIQALTSLFPELEKSACFGPAVTLVSEQRRNASHGVRPPAKSFRAFFQFTEDLELCLKAAKELLVMLESAFGVNGEQLCNRRQVKKMFPQIDRPSNPRYSINQASRMVGKTIERVEFGGRKKIEGVHESEALIIHFTDGSMMSLETGSNAGNLASDQNGLNPEEFHVDFVMQWVPPLRTNVPKRKR